MSLNIKKVQLGFRNEQLENKLSEDGQTMKSYFRNDGSGFGGVVVETISKDEYLQKAADNGLKLAKIERGDIPYIDGLKIPICMTIRLFKVRLDKDLNIISVSKSVTESLESLVDKYYKDTEFSNELRSEDYTIYISMDIGIRYINSVSSYIGERVTFDNLYQHETDSDGKDNVFKCHPKEGLENFSGNMYAKVIHSTKKLLDDTFKTETELVSIKELFKVNKGLKDKLGDILEVRLKNIDTIYASEDLILEQYIAETDLLALDVIKLVKKGTDSIDNPTGKLLGISVEALIDSDSAKHEVCGASTKYLPYLIKGTKGCIHSIKGIDSIKCICAVTNIMIDGVDENYLSILVPKGKLLDMKTKYIENLNTADKNTFPNFEDFNIEDIDSFFSNSSYERDKELDLQSLGGFVRPFGGSGNFDSGFGNPYGYDEKTLRKIYKQLNKARKNKF